MSGTLNGVIDIIGEQVLLQKQPRDRKDLQRAAFLQTLQIFTSVRTEQVQAKKRAQPENLTLHKLMHELAQAVAQFAISLASQLDDLEPIIYEIIDEMSMKEGERIEEAQSSTMATSFSKTELMSQFFKIV